MNQLILSDSASRKLKVIGLICIFLVVGIHGTGVHVSHSVGAQFTKDFLSQGVCRIAVPFFFVVSGYFLGIRTVHPGWYGTALKKRFRSLLLPYLAWSLLALLCYSTFAVVANVMAGRVLLANLPNPSLANFLGTDCGEYPYYFVCWYLRTLMLLMALSPIMVMCLRCRHGELLLGVLLCNLVIVLPSMVDVAWYKRFNYVLPARGLFYFTVGLALAIRQYAIKFHGGFLGVALCLFAVKTWMYGGGDESCGVICAVLYHAAVTSALLGLFASVPPVELPRCLQSIVFPIYLLHPLVIYAMGRTCSEFAMPLWGYFLEWFIAFGVSALVVDISRRSLPGIAAFLSGGRA